MVDKHNKAPVISLLKLGPPSDPKGVRGRRATTFHHLGMERALFEEKPTWNDPGR